VTWLASPAGRDVTGQILHVSGGQVGIMQQYAIIRSFKSDHLLEIDELDRVIPALVQAKLAADERGAKEGEPETLPS
jgi:hypothetical protein